MRFLRLPVAALVLVLSATALAPVPGLAAAPALLREAQPRPGSVVAAGTVEVSVDAVGALQRAHVTLDGRSLPTRVTGDGDGSRVTARGAVGSGSHVVRVDVVDAAGTPSSRLWRFAASDLEVRRIAGPDRIATAAAAARQAFPNGDAPAAVLARDDGFADALSGIPLATEAGGPLLLSQTHAVPPDTASALRRLLRPGARVYVLGGTAALAPAVVADLAAAGYDVTRLAGEDRYTTAVEIAREMARLGSDPGRAVLASGERFPDALAAAVPAAAGGWPILLTTPHRLPEATAAWLERGSVRHVEVVGGTAAIGPEVTLGLPSNVRVRRTGGANRYDSAAQIARRFPPASTQDDTAVIASGADHPDALAAAALGAQIGAPLLLSAAHLPPATAEAVAWGRGGAATVVGGPAVVPDGLVAALRRAHVDAGAALVERTPEPGAIIDEPVAGSSPVLTMRLRMPGVALDDRTQVTVLVDGREAAAATGRQADTVTVVVHDLPAGVASSGDLPVTVIAGLHGAGATAHAQYEFTLRRGALVATAEGFVGQAGTGAVAGSTGTLRTYSLEVEQVSGVEVRAFAEEAQAALTSARGWTGTGQRRLQRTEPAAAEIRVVLARPATVDRYCGSAGLQTGGRYSCWTGRFAMINLDRWNGGAAGFSGPLADYRGYVVNHELGHGLGYGHSACPRPGAPAPVMMQQTKGTGACLPNPWPYP